MSSEINMYNIATVTALGRHQYFEGLFFFLSENNFDRKYLQVK